MLQTLRQEICRLFNMPNSTSDIEISGQNTLTLVHYYYIHFLNTVCNRNDRLANFFRDFKPECLLVNRALPVETNPEDFPDDVPSFEACINCTIRIPDEYINEIVEILKTKPTGLFEPLQTDWNWNRKQTE